MVHSHVHLLLENWRKEFIASEYMMIHKGPCSLWDSLEKCCREVSWSTQGQMSPRRMRTLWPRPTETLPRNMMIYFSLQQMWTWMQPQLILPSSCLKRGNELPGRRSVRIFPAPHRDSTPLPIVLSQLSISSRRYFWEVQVGNTCSWDLEVCRVM